MTALLNGAGLGLAAGAGLVIAASRMPAARRPSLDDRTAPYIRDSAKPSKLLCRPRALTPFPTLERIVGPWLRDAIRVLERVVGGGGSARQRIERLGRESTLEQFRAEQLLWGGAAMLGFLALGFLGLAHGSIRQPFALMIGCLLAAMTGVLARDRWLSVEVTRRERRMMAEFPAIAELLALAVAAGEGTIGALERVARISTGELSRELERALADARAGASLATAMQGVADRTRLATLARFVDGVAIAVERGTPMAQVLRAQAVDAREAGKRALLETGGRKEIAMMVPVIFLVLPVTVVFATFPGLYGLTTAA